MKFAFALFSIAAAALQFVGAGPVSDEGLVSVSMFSIRICRVHCWHVVGKACPRPGHKARLRWKVL